MIKESFLKEFIYKRLLGLSLKKRGGKIFQREEWNIKKQKVGNRK